MKRLFLVCLAMLAFTSAGYCDGFGYKYIDGGGIFTNVTMPASVGRLSDDSEQDNFVNVSNRNFDISNLKIGKSSKANILGLVDTGDAGVMSAAKNGNINKIHYVETKKVKVYVPLGFIPIYVDTLETTVYGE